MDIMGNAVAASAAPNEAQTAGEAAKRALAGKEQFLQLLCAQISNQNPLNPMDDKEMVGQLAQFSAIEQAIETNSRLASLERSQTNAGRLGMASLIGKEGSASTARIDVVQGGTPPPLAFSLQGAADEVTVRMLDGNGNLVRSIDLRDVGPGDHHVGWDGRGKDRNPLPPGSYRMQVSANAQGGQEVVSRTEVRGRIERIEMDGKEPAVYLGAVRVPVTELTELRN